MSDPVLERLRDLEARSAPLEPDADARETLAQAAFLHAEALLDELESAPVHRPDGGSRAITDQPIGPDPVDPSTVFSLLVRHVDAPGVSAHAPGFMGFIPGGNLYHGAIADFLAAVSNRYSAHSMGGPGAVRVENQVIRWIASVLGYPAGAAGNLASGGSIANLTAIVTAREAAGIRAASVPRACVYLTEHAHHSIEKGLRIAGLGECPLRRVRLDESFRMTPQALEEAMDLDLRAGRIPWLVIASAGSVDAGAVDPLADIAAIAARRGAWLHVDGAYGGMFALCAEGRRLLAGIDRSDSVVVDPHKGLHVPYGVGAVLVRNGKALQNAHRFEASYLSEPIHAEGEPSPIDHSAEMSRPFRGLRLWLPLLLLGTRPFEASLEEKLLLARYAHRKLSELPGMETGPAPDLSIVVFRVRAPGAEGDEATERLVRDIRAEGRVFLSTTRLGGRCFARMAILAARTHREQVDRALDAIRERTAALTPA